MNFSHFMKMQIDEFEFLVASMQHHTALKVKVFFTMLEISP